MTWLSCYVKEETKIHDIHEHAHLPIPNLTALLWATSCLLSSRTLLRKLTCSCISLRLFETLQSLFWSVFGLLNLYVTNVKARHEFTEFVGATMFGTYNVISLVVLLNMLIAMMNNSYQLIAVSNCFTMGLPWVSGEAPVIWSPLQAL